MATHATYVGIEPRSVIPTAVAVPRGARVTIAPTTGLVAASAIGVRGDFVSLVDAAASEPFAAASMQGGGKVPALASEATTVGATAYSAASGKFSVTATDAVIVGKWTMAASGDGVLGEVELLNPL